MNLPENQITKTVNWNQSRNTYSFLQRNAAYFSSSKYCIVLKAHSPWTLAPLCRDNPKCWNNDKDGFKCILEPWSLVMFTAL